MIWEITIRDIIQVRKPNQVIHLHRFAQSCFLFGATHDYLWKLPRTNHSLGICRTRKKALFLFFVFFLPEWGFLSSFTIWWWPYCLGTPSIHPVRPMALIALDFYVIGITQQILTSHFASCNSCLLQPRLRYCCWGTRHYGICLVPTHPGLTYLSPWGYRWASMGCCWLAHYLPP